MEFIWRGIIPYETAFAEQKELVQTSKQEVWGLEHPSVVTLGKRLNSTINPTIQNETKLRLPSEFNVVETDRGGQATLHNVGQLIIYPQFLLNHYNLTVRTYIEKLLQITQITLLNLNIDSFIETEQTGIFTKNGKIASVGIRVQRGRTYHGLAINVSNDLSEFQFIQACGMWNRPQDKITHWNKNVTTEILFQEWCRTWDQVLN